MTRVPSFQQLVHTIASDDTFLPWEPLHTAGRSPAVRATGGLYRIRVTGATTWMYVGATNGALQDPIRYIQRALRDKSVPKHEPHTAGAHLWWHNKNNGLQYEASLLPLPDLQNGERLLLKSFVLALYRSKHQRSPAANYSRLPLGLRQQQPEIPQHRFHPGAPPLGSLASFGAYGTRLWGHYIWSPWSRVPTDPGAVPSGRGFYRLRRRSDGLPLWVGKGEIRSGIQGGVFRHQSTDIEYSLVHTPTLPQHICRERLDDLIGGLLLELTPSPVTPALRRLNPISLWRDEKAA